MLEIPPTLAFYVWIPIFFAFIVALKSLVFEPTQALLEEREKRTTGAQAEAEAMRDDAADMQSEFERRLAEARLAGGNAGEQVRREAEAREHQILEEARQEATRTVEEVRGRIGEESDQARAQLRSEADNLAKLVAEKVLGRAVGS